MADKDLGTLIPEIRISFEIPASFFRMRYSEKQPQAAQGSFVNPGTLGFPNKIWEYEVDLTVPECSEYAGVPAGLWTFAISRTLEYTATTQYREKDVSVSLHPQASVLGNWTTTASDSRGFRISFFAGFSAFTPSRPCQGESSFTIWKGKGTYHDNKWTCNPARCAFSSSLPPRFLDDNSMVKGTKWSVDLLFHITIPSKSTVDKLTGLAGKFDSLLKMATFADCTLISADGKEFPAHRAILCAQSPVFAAMFINDMTEKWTGICKITDINGDVLEVVLEFLYGRTVNEQLKSNVEDALVAAHRYDMDDLLNVCEDLLTAGLNKENAVRYLGLAVLYGLDTLMKRAAKFVAEQ